MLLAFGEKPRFMGAECFCHLEKNLDFGGLNAFTQRRKTPLYAVLNAFTK